MQTRNFPAAMLHSSPGQSWSESRTTAKDDSARSLRSSRESYRPWSPICWNSSDYSRFDFPVARRNASKKSRHARESHSRRTIAEHVKRDNPVLTLKIDGENSP